MKTFKPVVPGQGNETLRTIQLLELAIKAIERADPATAKRAVIIALAELIS